MTQKQFEGKSVIVTGGTRGIGAAIGLELARRGANIAFNDIVIADEAEQLKADIEALGVKAFMAVCATLRIPRLRRNLWARSKSHSARSICL